ncbi:MAG: hypothetical protein WC632_06100 [Candidatus Margulisiibacteriota bacterium]
MAKPKKKAIKKVVKKVKKGKKPKKVLLRKKAVKKIKVQAAPKEKVIGKIDHYFDKISVAAIKVKGPFKVGDIIHIKGHTTDFVQKIASMQINHREVEKVKRGDDVGLKVREHVRDHDLVYLAGKESAARLSPVTMAQAQPVAVEPRPLAGQKPKALYQTSIFNAEKSLTRPVVKPVPQPSAAPPPPAAPHPAPEKKKNDPYSGTKFFNF